MYVYVQDQIEKIFLTLEKYRRSILSKRLRFREGANRGVLRYNRLDMYLLNADLGK